MKHEDDADILDLYSFDESGVTGVPEIPYAWLDEDDHVDSEWKNLKNQGFGIFR